MWNPDARRETLLFMFPVDVLVDLRLGARIHSMFLQELDWWDRGRVGRHEAVW